MSLEVEYLPISELKTYANNAKIHTGDQIEQIKDSIKEFGFNDPIAIWENNEIIEGHGRLIAADELGIKELPVIRLNNLSDQERRAYALIHNKLTMDTEFNFDIMMMEIDQISMDMEKYGFSEKMESFEYAIKNEEFDVEDFGDEKFEYECPECGFKFNS